MAESITPIRISSKQGIKRDGTLLDSMYHVDGKWCRWQETRARKMGGYRRLTNLLSGIGRGMNVFDQNNETYTHIGSAAVLQQMLIDPNGVVSSITDRTPAGFTADAMNLWQFDTAYDTGTATLGLLAHAAPNATDISSNVTAPVYFGSATAGTALTTTGFTSCSGGVAVSGPYTWAFGSNGVVEWSPPNDPPGYGGSGSGTAAICSAKIVRAMPLRAGAGNGPAILFWSLNSLERATFVGGTAIFNFDTITSQSSILSAASVIEYNGVYFWIGVDSFMLYNGVVRELQNDMNANYFFTGINYAYRSRVFAFKVPRFGEIWWCYPRGSATECTHAIIYNVTLNTWYDTELPNGGRSCAQYAQVFTSPLMCGVDADTSTGSTTYKLWQHEFGTDAIDGSEVLAVESYYETSELGLPFTDDGSNTGGSKQSLANNMIEPDFVQTGDMYCIVKARWNARSEEHVSDPYPFVANPTIPAEELIKIRETGRFLRFRFGSNTQGGNYQSGKIMGHFQTADARITS